MLNVFIKTQEFQQMEIKMKLKLLGLAAASALAFSVQASDVPYSFAEIGYASASIGDDGISVDGDGFKLAGSADFGNNFYGFGEYATYGFSGGSDLDYSGLGVGYKYAASANTDFVFELSYRNLGFDSDFGSDSESGLGLGIGVRSMVASNVELGALIETVEIDSDRETFFGVNGAYYFTPNWAVAAEADFSDAFDTYAIKLRYRF